MPQRKRLSLRRVLGIPAEYAVIFVQGGGSMQVHHGADESVPAGQARGRAAHRHAWTAKAVAELKKGIAYRIAASSEAAKFMRVPRAEEITLSPEASYVYLCSNNTIEGTQWPAFPEAGGVPLVADMSSDIASRPIDVKQFGLIFAGAQKNLGPAGTTVVIVRKDLAERADKNLPTLLQYRTHIKEKSLYQTPPTFAIYVVGLVLEWIESLGGLGAVEKRNDSGKAKLALRRHRRRRLLQLPGGKELPLENERRIPGCGRR